VRTQLTRLKRLQATLAETVQIVDKLGQDLKDAAQVLW
jgi:hypothetical protein